MYAAQHDNGTVVQIIVGTADWAESRLGGEWIHTEALVGIGWQVVDGVIVPPEPEPDVEVLP
jgi:hypothetical protein